MINRIISVIAVVTLSITLSSQVFAGPKLTMLINQSLGLTALLKH